MKTIKTTHIYSRNRRKTTKTCVLIFYFLNIVAISNCQNNLSPLNINKCKISHEVDISNSSFNHETKNIEHDNAIYTPDNYFHQDGKIIGCLCDVQLCIPKCCEPNEEGIVECEPEYSHKVRVTTYHNNLTIAENDTQHGNIFWNSCMYLTSEDHDINVYIMEDGRLYAPAHEQYFELNEYCVVQFSNDSFDRTEVRMCFGEEDPDTSTEMNKYGMIVSIPFLFATLLVYFILPNKNLQTKCLMAYLTCLMLAYFFLIYLQFNSKSTNPSMCLVLGGCGVYFFMSTFCWMNITCVDMYWTFSGNRAPVQATSAKWKLFARYAAFANGVPLIHLAVLFGINSMEQFSLHPMFGENMCWINYGEPQLLYFYGPMAVLLTINIVLFSITAYTIRTTIRDNQKMLRSKESQRHHESNRQDYLLYIKLFVAMGINWSFEFVSWIVDFSIGYHDYQWLWYPTDFCNAIYGIFIFIIFVCKRAVLVKLKQRYYISVGRPDIARALSTRTSGYQMSQTERTHVDESVTNNNKQ